ncbi:uncharacterized protein LOC142219818 [Haematobia irritans]|uniref:uncharacterized protein LOC142219818 n=1 Tax=Haematobia irritans TaxID=7368 RepID=UPI003F50D056
MVFLPINHLTDMYTKSEIMRAATTFYCPFNRDVHFGKSSLCLDCHQKYRKGAKSPIVKTQEKFWSALKLYAGKSRNKDFVKYQFITNAPMQPQRNVISREVMAERCQSGASNFNDRLLYNILIANSVCMYM